MATDPLTGKTINWVAPPESALYTVPIVACTDDRNVARWTFPWELPCLTAVLGSNYYVSAKTWQGTAYGLWKYAAADLSFSGVVRHDAGYTTTYTSVMQVDYFAGMHLGTSIHASTVIEFAVTQAGQGPGDVHLYTYDGSAAALTDVGVLTYDGDKIGGLDYTSAYMVKSCITASGTRVLGAAWTTSDANQHAVVFTKAGSFPTSGWTKKILIQNSSMIFNLATSGTGASTVIVALFGSLYGAQRTGMAFTLDNGTTWYYLVPNGASFAAVAVPATGMTHAAYTVAGYWLRDATLTIDAPGSMLINGTTLWVSTLRCTTVSSAYAGLTGNAAHYLCRYDLSATTPNYAEYGPFFNDAPAGWWAAMQAEWNGSLIRLARAIPRTGTNPDAGYNDHPDGGPTIGIYAYNPATPTVAPSLTKTIALDGAGSSQDYTDRVWGVYPAHEQGYGDHQVILGCRWVVGATGKLALNISDQRPTGTNLHYHMSRLKIVDAT